MSTPTTTPPDDRPEAVVCAERGTDAWSDVARHQRWAPVDHSDLYALAGELTSTLHTFEDLTALLVEQVAGYGTGRVLVDDTHEVDPAARLADAASALGDARTALQAAARAASDFWTDIGHIGVEVAP